MGELVLLTSYDLKRNCMNCEHAYIGSRGIFCEEFNEIIYDDTIAFECDSYENG